MNIFRDELNDLIKDCPATLTVIAKNVGISVGYLSGIRHGHMPRPPRSVIERLDFTFECERRLIIAGVTERIMELQKEIEGEQEYAMQN